MKRFGLAALVTVTIAAPVVANAQVDPLGLIPALKAAVPKAAAPVAPNAAPAWCGISRRPYMPSFGAPPTGYPATLWPDADQCAYEFAELKFTAGAQQKRAFADASRVRCGDCEGGYAYDSWANVFAEKDASKSKFDARVAALPIGKSITWTGAKYKGEVVATGELPIGTTPCKQYRWTLRLGGKVTAERDGLFCRIGDRWREMV